MHPAPTVYLSPTIQHIPCPGCWSAIYQPLTYDAHLKSFLDSIQWTSPNSNPSLLVHPDFVIPLQSTPPMPSPTSIHNHPLVTSAPTQNPSNNNHSIVSNTIASGLSSPTTIPPYILSSTSVGLADLLSSLALPSN